MTSVDGADDDYVSTSAVSQPRQEPFGTKPGAVPSVEGLRLAEFLIQRWMPTYAFNWADGTMRFRQWAIHDVLIPDLGARALVELSTEDLLNWVALRSRSSRAQSPRPLAPGTLRNVYSVLSQSLGQAERWGLIAKSPARGIRLPRAVPSARVWTLEQVRHFLQDTSESRYACLWSLMFATGIRRGEALGLRWRDFDRIDGIVHIERALLASSRSKSLIYGPVKTPRSRRSIALDSGTVDALQAWRLLREFEADRCIRSDTTGRPEAPHPSGALCFALGPDDPVFTRSDGTPWLPAGVSDAFRRHVRLSGLPAIRLHDVRHTHLTHLLRGGEPIQNVSA